jgi:hypothetical protein
MSITRTAPFGTVLDDTGGGTDGTVINNVWVQGLLDLLDARWSRATTTLTGTQTVINPSEADLLICNNATDLTIRSITAPSSPAKPAKKLVIVSTGAGNVFLSNQDTTGTTAANRMINMITSGLTPLAAGTGIAIMVYDDNASRWRLVAHYQGAPIGCTLSDGSTGALALTQAARYLAAGRQIFVEFDLTYPATASAGTAVVTGLPFSAMGSINGNVALSYSTFGAGIYMVVGAGGVGMTFWDLSGVARTNANVSGKAFQGRAMYFTS